MGKFTSDRRIIDRQLRFTFVLPQLRRKPIGGYRIVYEYASRLSMRGHHVTLVHPMIPPGGGALSRMLKRSEWKERIAHHRSGTSIPWFSFPSTVDNRIVRRLTPEIFPDGDVLCATSWRTAQCVAAAKSSMGQKLYMIQHYETWDAPKDLLDQTWRLPMHKIVISKWLAHLASAMGESSRTTYIPNGINFDQFALRTPYSSREPHRVGMLTHSKKWKGTFDGLTALELTRKSIPDLRVTLFGTGDRPPQAPAWMEYRQNVTGDALRDLYNEVAVFLHPSWAEGWPLPPAEAMACGCALVAADNPGVLDYVIDRATAMVAPRADPTSLARVLTKVLIDDSLRQSVASSGYHSIRWYTWTRAIDTLETLLAESTSTQASKS